MPSPWLRGNIPPLLSETLAMIKHIGAHQIIPAITTHPNALTLPGQPALSAGVHGLPDTIF